MKVEDVEWSLYRHLEDTLVVPEPLRVLPMARPGTYFSPERCHAWIEPRIQRVEWPLVSRDTQDWGRLDLFVTCLVRSDHKGGVFTLLSRVVDAVRDVIDTGRNANAANIYTADTNTVIGMIEWSGTEEERDYGVALDLRGVENTGLDISTISTRAILTAVP